MDKLYKRSFLNPKTGVAACTILLEKVKETEYTGSIEISDCNRLVRLDMDFWTPKMKKDKMYKLNRLISLLTEFRDQAEKTTLKKF